MRRKAFCTCLDVGMYDALWSDVLGFCGVALGIVSDYVCEVWEFSFFVSGHELEGIGVLVLVQGPQSGYGFYLMDLEVVGVGCVGIGIWRLL